MICLQNQFLPPEGSATDDHHSVRSQSLCHGSGVSERRSALRSRKARARSWLPPMGRVFALSHSRNGRSDGAWQIVAQRLGPVWRNLGIPYCDNCRIWPVSVSVPARCARETKGFLYRSSILPNHVRAYGALRRVFGVLCLANHESFAALEPSDVQLGTFQPRDQ